MLLPFEAGFFMPPRPHRPLRPHIRSDRSSLAGDDDQSGDVIIPPPQPVGPVCAGQGCDNSVTECHTARMLQCLGPPAGV